MCYSPSGRQLQAAGRTSEEAEGKNTFYNSWRTRCRRHPHIKGLKRQPLRNQTPKFGKSRLGISFQDDPCGYKEPKQALLSSSEGI